MEEFVLPQNWWIRVTDENKDILTKWFGDDGLTNMDLVGITKVMHSGDVYYSKSFNHFDSIKSYDEGYYHFDFGEEITYDQFIEYVFKEDIISNFKFGR